MKPLPKPIDALLIAVTIGATFTLTALFFTLPAIVYVCSWAVEIGVHSVRVGGRG